MTRPSPRIALPLRPNWFHILLCLADGGRTFTDRDERDDARVLIVNETLATQVWPGENPVGRTVDLDNEQWQVIGVVGDPLRVSTRADDAGAVSPGDAVGLRRAFEAGRERRRSRRPRIRRRGRNCGGKSRFWIRSC